MSWLGYKMSLLRNNYRSFDRIVTLPQEIFAIRKFLFLFAVKLQWRIDKLDCPLEDEVINSTLPSATERWLLGHLISNLLISVIPWKNS